MMAGRKYEPDRAKVRKNSMVNISVSPNEKAEIEQEARAMGLSNSAYLRLLWLTNRKEVR
jgi:hypothetical protein